MPSHRDQSHAPIEPQNCTAHVQKDRCDIWCPTQNQTAALRAASAVTGLEFDRIHVHTTHLGVEQILVKKRKYG
ncbi:MAG: molybdopterin cofactor-binding domain-containing protein [Thermodesulfobacteriota bacterium]